MRKHSYQEMVLKLRTARIQLGLSQSDVAEKLNKTQSYISRCETGFRHLDLVELEEFAKVYDKPIEFFLFSDFGG